MKNYIKLISHPHSGSTLLAFLLGNHPQIASVGELAGRTDFEEYKCSCGKLMEECTFWVGIARIMESKGYHLDLRNFGIRIGYIKPFSRLDWIYNRYLPNRKLDIMRDILFIFNKKRKKWVDEIIRKNIMLSHVITKYYEKDHFFDSTKDLYRMRHMARGLGDRLKIINLKRDGRGVVNSLINKENRTLKQAISGWMWSQTMINRVIENYFDKNDVLSLKYEDLCSNVEGSLKSVHSFVGVDHKVDMNFFDQNEFHVIGNHMRKTFNGKIALDEKWKKELSPESLSFFDQRAGEMNKAIGYD